MSTDFLTRDRFVADAMTLVEPPSWTRLEPQSSAGDPRPGIEARVHDPLWMLGRQWQLGEFEGEDAGTPLTVRVVTKTIKVDRWAAGSDPQGKAFGAEPPDLLEPLVEREPITTRAPGLRPRAEAAAALLAALDDAGLGSFRKAIVQHCPLDLNPIDHPDGAHADLDPTWLRLVRLLRNREVADAELVCEAIEAAGGLPPWLMPANATQKQELGDAIAGWMAWYRAEVSPLPGGTDAFVGERLEYRFRIGAGNDVLAAPDHDGAGIDWYSFDPASSAELPLIDAEPAEVREEHKLLASPLRYPGMPADRLWEMEDAQVNLGVVEAEPWDLARLLVAEFALTYGNDWLVVPVDVPLGSLARVESVIYTTTFGERFVVRSTGDVSPDGRWRMFTVAAASGASTEGLLIPPGAVAVQRGAPIEEVLFLRDEMANLAWAVERLVQGPSGVSRDRSREGDGPSLASRGPVERAQLDYRLQSNVAARWIPYLPRSLGYRAVQLVQGRMPAIDGASPVPLGELLQRPDLQTLHDAEVPREGVLVRRMPSMTRRSDGSYLRWTTRQVSIGRGEGASRLAFDSAISRKPRPND
ncbi:MAG: hypothetical protein QM778_18465 [Myxococcales bacterium]